MIEPDPIILKQLDDMGPEIVRQRLGELSPTVKPLAIAWLAQHDREARERAAFANSEQMELARSANALAERSVKAAQISNTVAAASAVMAAIAIAISVIGLIHSWRGGADARNTQPQAAQAHGRRAP